MDYFRKIAGWERAAKKYTDLQPINQVYLPKLTPEEEGEMQVTRHLIQ
jgi:hypothetical protein